MLFDKKKNKNKKCWMYIMKYEISDYEFNDWIYCLIRKLIKIKNKKIKK